MAKFQSRSGGHVSIYVSWSPNPIELQADGVYQTTDDRELEALRASSEAAEVVEPSGSDEPVAKDTKEPVADSTATAAGALPKRARKG